MRGLLDPARWFNSRCRTEYRTVHRYAHFVVGGITYNIGLRAPLAAVEVVGAPAAPALPR